MGKPQHLPSVDTTAAPVLNGAHTAAAPVHGYRPRRVDVKLPMAHREILHAKLRQLQDDGARLKDGTEVSDRSKAVLWILENEVTL